MKRLLLIIGIMLLVGFTKCEKCATCTTKTTCTGGYVTTTTFEACGSDIKEVDGQTVTSTQTTGGITVTCTAKTTCQ